MCSIFVSENVIETEFYLNNNNIKMVILKKILWGRIAEQYGNMLHDLSSKFHVMYVLFQIGSRRQNFSTFFLCIRFRDMCAEAHWSTLLH